MRKTTINLIVGILLGICIVKVSEYGELPTETTQTVPALATTNPIKSNPDNIFEQDIAPGLQIIEVPPPLNLMGNHPYQCYMNGEPINIPKELVKQLVAKHGNPSENNPNFNVHNFTGNLKMVQVTQGE